MPATPISCSAVSAAPISEPSSIVPVVSTVTCARIGMSLPRSARARRAPITAALACSKSCAVSIRIASAPPSISPVDSAKYASRNVMKSV